MCLPEIIKAVNISSGSDEPHGIIYYVRNNILVSNLNNFFKLSTNATSPSGSLDTLISWNNVWSSSNSKNSYVQIEFKNKYVFPTHYSLKGAKGYYFAKEWNLYGFNSENEEPVLLATDNSIESTYCGDPSTCLTGYDCCNDDWGTFSINITNKGYRFFRLKCKTPSYEPLPYRFVVSGFEIFGTLSSSLKMKKRTFCFNSYPTNNHLPAYALLRMLSVYMTK